MLLDFIDADADWSVLSKLVADAVFTSFGFSIALVSFVLQLCCLLLPCPNSEISSFYTIWLRMVDELHRCFDLP